MTTQLPILPPAACGDTLVSSASTEALNRECFCLSVDQLALRTELETVLGAHGVPAALADSHPNLFSSLPVFVSRRHIEQTAAVVLALEEVSALPDYQAAVLAWAPEIAGFDPGSPGGLLGLDFHLGPEGPRLIEINTNPGGVLLNAVLGQAQQACLACRIESPTDAARVEEAVLQAMLTEWRLQRGTAVLQTVAIIDAQPGQQYLYPEFVLFRELFRRAGYVALIGGPDELSHRDGRLWLGTTALDLVYNRLTDFALEEPANAALRAAYLAGEVVLSPHPRAHALLADKRNLALLGDRRFLEEAGASADAVAALVAGVPRTRLLTAGNRDTLWAERRKLFFKPAAGFGSKASYRGDKLTRRVWEEMAAGVYVAQDIVAPSERALAQGADPLKVDLRCYSYRGEVLLYAARMYQGQTTNFRTPGGGFAPVLTGWA